MEFLMQFQLPVVTGLCLCVGYILKNAVHGEAINRFIPLIMGSLGALLSVWINLAVTPAVLLSGTVSGLASTGLYEAFKSFLKREK